MLLTRRPDGTPGPQPGRHPATSGRGAGLHGGQRRLVSRSRFFYDYALGVTEYALCLLSAVADGSEADAAEFRDGAQHVEHYAALTRLVKVEPVPDCNVEEVVDREAAQQI